MKRRMYPLTSPSAHGNTDSAANVVSCRLMSGACTARVLRSCRQCDYSTPYLQSLKTHMYKHHGLDVEEAKPFVCKMCPYRTNYKGNLRKHLRTHTGERPYVCRVCNKGFTTTSNLKTHEIHRHGIQYSKRPGLPLYSRRHSLTGSMKEELAIMADEELRKEGDEGSPLDQKPQLIDLHKSPASGSVLSVSSDDVSEVVEDQKPILPLAMLDAYASDEDRKEDIAIVSPNSLQCSPGSSMAVFPEAVPVSKSSVQTARASQRKPASPARYPVAHSQPQTSSSWMHSSASSAAAGKPANTETASTAQPQQPVSFVDNLFLEPQNLINNLCASIPQLPPHVFASLHALNSAQRQYSLPSFQPPANSSGVDELTKALLDQLVKEGRLFRCEHCNILFPEISLYIFHRGCHGQGSPFQCHFCHTVFREKFEFMAHFMFCVHNKK